jgi:hypothetical protein
VTLIVLIHATPPLIYETLRYSWAWKHIGIVDYIQRFGTVDPEIGILGVYHNWPTFFGLNAFLTDLINSPSAQLYAGLAPFFFELVYLFAIVGLLRMFTANKRLPWLAAWFFVLANWVGQDYFSPQAMNFFLYLVFLWAVITWNGPEKELRFSRWADSRLSQPLRPLFEKMDQMVVQIQSIWQPTSAIEILPTSFITLLIFGLIVASHQLTPIMAISVVIVLVIFGYCSWRTLPLVMIGTLALWLAFPASTYSYEFLNDVIESFGQITKNIDSSLINVAQVSAGQTIVVWMGRGLTLAIVVLAILGFIRRIRKGHLDFLPVIPMLSPISLLVTSPYGGEALFRVYLFALPFLAYMAAGLILPTEETTSGRYQPLAVIGISAMLAVGLLFSHFGKDKQYVFTNAEVEASWYLYNSAEPNSLLIEGARNYPGTFKNYEFFTYVPIDREKPETRSRILNDPVEVLADWLDNERYSRTFLIITRSQKAYIDAVGVMPPGSLDDIERALIQSDQLEIVFANEDATIFRLQEK